MKKLSDLFREFDDVNINQRVIEARALGFWDEVVGELISNNTEPLYIRNGTLFVRTKSPAWSQELKGLSTDIQRKINNKVRKDIIREIRFVNGAISRESQKEKTDDWGRIDESPNLGEKDTREIKEAAANIDEQDLREAFIRFMEKDLRHRKKDKKIQDNKV